ICYRPKSPRFRANGMSKHPAIKNKLPFVSLQGLKSQTDLPTAPPRALSGHGDAWFYSFCFMYKEFAR
ncbi:MAG: hypothetical protein KAS38_06415, partial [Anaerolineales bacterium]|nr:hypothetical protein [Anaerolineales bacterium]